MFKSFLKFIGLLGDNDEELKSLVANSYQSIRVTSKGTIYIDPREVHSTSEFKEAQQQAKQIVP